MEHLGYEATNPIEPSEKNDRRRNMGPSFGYLIQAKDEHEGHSSDRQGRQDGFHGAFQLKLRSDPPVLKASKKMEKWSNSEVNLNMMDLNDLTGFNSFWKDELRLWVSSDFKVVYKWRTLNLRGFWRLALTGIDRTPGVVREI